MGLDTFGEFFKVAQALSVRGDHNDSDTDGKKNTGILLEHSFYN